MIYRVLVTTSALLVVFTGVLAQDDVEPIAEEGATAQPAAAYADRRYESREALDHEDRVIAVLDWLVDHQGRDGSWSPARFHEATKRNDAEFTYNLEFRQPGDESGDIGWTKLEREPVVGVTGLALMAFAGAGFAHDSGTYEQPVKSGLDFLLKQQLSDGGFLADDRYHFAYEHAVATMAIADLYGLTGDEALAPVLETACACIIEAQNPGLGWRYQPRQGINDTSCTGYMMLALHKATEAGIELDLKHVWKSTLSWLDLVCVKVCGDWKTGYDSPGSNNARLRDAESDELKGFDTNETLDAVHGLIRIHSGKKVRNDSLLRKLRDVVRRSDRAPVWKPRRIDMQFWFWGTLFLKACKYWDDWRDKLYPALLKSQRGFSETDEAANRTSVDTLDEHGSWDAVSAWSESGGRVYTTAMGAILLCIELQ